MHLTDSSLTLHPTDPSTGRDALLLGYSTTASQLTLTNSTLSVSRSNNSGAALSVESGSTVSLINSTLILQAESGTGDLSLTGAGSSFACDANSSVTATGDLLFANNTSGSLAGTIEAQALLISQGVTGQVTFSGGTITLNNSTPFRTNNPANGNLAFTGAANSSQIILTDPSNQSKDLGFRLSGGYFAIDSTVITPTTAWNGSNAAALNAELATLGVGGRFLQFIDGPTTQTITLTDTPIIGSGAISSAILPAWPTTPLPHIDPPLASTGTSLVDSANAKGQSFSLSSASTVTGFVFQVSGTVTPGALSVSIYPGMDNLPWLDPILQEHQLGFCVW